MKIFICKYCKEKGKEFISTRTGLRLHLKTEHIRNKYLTNVKDSGKQNTPYVKQDWWITEELK